jgi:hypothetical protein
MVMILESAVGEIFRERLTSSYLGRYSTVKAEPRRTSGYLSSITGLRVEAAMMSQADWTAAWKATSNKKKEKEHQRPISLATYIH